MDIEKIKRYIDLFNKGYITISECSKFILSEYNSITPDTALNKDEQKAVLKIENVISKLANINF